MSRLLTSAGLLSALVSASAHAAPPVGYAQATNYFKKDSRPTLYQPLNLLDGRELTAWCTATADPLNDALTFGFKGPATIDEIRVYTGNGFDSETFTAFSRGKKFVLKGPDGARSFTVADQRGLQAVAVNPPLSGAQFSLEVVDLYPAEDPEAPVCVTDVVFYSGGKPLNGSWLTPKLKYDRRRAPLLGTWFGGYEGAPDHFLSFYFDGTYRFVYSPYDKPEAARAYSGDYEVAGSRISLELSRKGKRTARFERGSSGGAPGATRTLKLEGGDLPEELKQVFRSQP